MTLDEGSSAGRAMLQIARDGWVVVADTRRHRPVWWWDEDHEYRTFVAGPVSGRDHVFGLLTLDALGPGELTSLDLPLIRLLADMLALALGL